MGLTKVSTDGVKDDAITSGKIPANAVGASELADNAVDTNAIANNAVTAGKTSGVQTTINQNASDRVITGSSTANNLNAQSGLTYNGLDLNISNDVPQLLLTDNNSNSSIGRVRGNGGNLILSADTNNATAGSIINFEIDGTERMRIDSSGNVGINKTNPSSALDVNGVVEVNDPSVSTDAKIIVKGNDTNNHDIITAYSNLSTRGSFAIRTGSGISPSFLIGTRGSNETLALMTNNTERLRVTDNGLTFNGDTAAANALDDYEEGTFTPAFTSTNGGLSVGYSVQLGKYIKVGRLVYISFYIILNAVNNNGSGAFMVTGLPFTHDSTSQHYASLTVGYYAGTNNTIMQNGLVNTNDTTVHLFNGNSTPTVSNSTAAGVLTTSFQLLMSGTYMST